MNRERENSEQVAAFFDVDGTLLAGPSLELRFFRELRKRRVIPARNYFFWLAQAARNLPRGIQAVQHANKMYVRGIRTDCGNEQVRVAGLYRAGLERLRWHAEQGHAIFLISGTLASLAQRVALEIVTRLLARGITAKIGVCATRLEERSGCWTGRIVGEAMYGEAKARAVKRLAREHSFEMDGCFAYGNEANDRWMLESVGRPVAVNPSEDLTRMAQRERWPIFHWDAERKLERQTQRMQTAHGSAEALAGPRNLG